MKKITVCISVFLVLTVFMTACSIVKKPDADNIEKIIAEETPKKAAEAILSTMKLEEKIWQMMFVAPEDITGVSVAIKAGDATKAALEKYPVGGIIYFGQNFKTREQTMELISNSQSYSKIPLFISVDEEGGVVSRIGSKPELGTRKQPPMLEIGKTGDVAKAYNVGAELSEDLKELGFNVDFAPVADVLVSRDNVETGTRSFGYDAKLAASMVENVVKGLQSGNVSATLKHFPGAGATTVDSHTGYSENPRTLKELRKTEFLPFEAGIDAGADFVMMSHMTLVKASKDKLPCSISEEVIQGMLKDELGFEGIVITDSLRMGAITEHYSPQEIGVLAVKAGIDMILMPKDIFATHQGIVDAVKNGEISEKRINESVTKILIKKIEKSMWKR